MAIPKVPTILKVPATEVAVTEVPKVVLAPLTAQEQRLVDHILVEIRKVVSEELAKHWLLR